MRLPASFDPNQAQSTHRLTYRTMVASFDRSSKWAASTADTMAPSSAERSHISSVTRNLRARLKNAAGPFDALTAMTCLGRRASSDGVVGDVLSDAWSRLVVVADGFLSLEDATSCSSATSLGGVDGLGCVVGSALGMGVVVCTVGFLVAFAACFPVFHAPRSVDMLLKEVPRFALFQQERFPIT